MIRNAISLLSKIWKHLRNPNFTKDLSFHQHEISAECEGCLSLSGGADARKPRSRVTASQSQCLARDPERQHVQNLYWHVWCCFLLCSFVSVFNKLLTIKPCHLKSNILFFVVFQIHFSDFLSQKCQLEDTSNRKHW